MTALDRAVTLPEGDAVALRVGEDLDLNVTRTLEPALKEDLVVAERLGGLTLSRADLLDKVLDVANNTHTLSTTTVGRLDEEGEADLGGGLSKNLLALLGAVVAGHAGDASSDHNLLALTLAAHGADGLGGGTDELEAGSADGRGELGRLGEETVAGVNGLESVLAQKHNNSHQLQRPWQRQESCP